ncbi:hypothetical protein QTI66_22900 [Variovorax sp. J22R133]|uniref:hypothetical protein n=1 Tax=Variovorax brevis TaxID=3053503 RepID=UPI002575FAF9|nr:hypothetical protein [Variovorax sp. J22R133]MDM0115016.1 hypothetical protein [Variovorax sp. J22R133]
MLLSEVVLRSVSLPLADAVYAGAGPGSFANGETVLLFEAPDAFLIVRADFHTRLLFTEPRILDRRVELPVVGTTSLAEVLQHHRHPADPLWAAVGLPGVPLAIGVNGSVRTHDNVCELLARKGANAQGEMAWTVGPPVSAGANFEPDALDLDQLTLGALVDHAMRVAAARELAPCPSPAWVRRAAWLDRRRGHKPEVNYTALISPSMLDAHARAVSQTHAGCVVARGHLHENGTLKDSAVNELERWGLNFQAWMLWEPA